MIFTICFYVINLLPILTVSGVAYFLYISSNEFIQQFVQFFYNITNAIKL